LHSDIGKGASVLRACGTIARGAIAHGTIAHGTIAHGTTVHGLTAAIRAKPDDRTANWVCDAKGSEVSRQKHSRVDIMVVWSWQVFCPLGQVQYPDSKQIKHEGPL
jgi:hypothetical protein